MLWRAYRVNSIKGQGHFGFPTYRIDNDTVEIIFVTSQRITFEKNEELKNNIDPKIPKTDKKHKSYMLPNPRIDKIKNLVKLYEEYRIADEDMPLAIEVSQRPVSKQVKIHNKKR